MSKFFKYLPLLALVLVWSCDDENNSEPEKEMPKEGLVAYYPFNNDANDYSGNANHGSNLGATLTTDRFGDENSAFDFDGIDDYINCGNELVLNQEVSISLWYKCSTQDNNNFILEKYNWREPWEAGISIGTVDDINIRFGGRNKTGEFYLTQSTDINLLDNNWKNVIGVIRNNVWELWVDGVLFETINSLNGNLSNEDDLIIGNLFIGNEDQNRYFDGLIDDVRIYNRALSSDEIQLLYHENGWDE